MLFEIHSSCEPSSLLFNRWSELAQTPMEHPCWLMNWWNVYARQKPENELFIVSIRDESATIAIAPLYLDGGVLRLLGDGRVCTDHLELLIGEPADHGTWRSRALELLDWLARAEVASRWKRIELESVPQNGLTHSVCQRIHDRVWVHQSDALPTCEIDLPATWEAYLASLSKNHRKRCRRWLREYDRHGNLESISTRDGWPTDDALDTLVRLHNERRNALHCEEPSLFTCTSFLKFLKAAFVDLSQLGMAEISAIRLDQQLLAVELEFHGASTTYAYQSGLAMAGLQHSGGSLSLLSRIRSAIENGRSTYDLMRGDEQYKFRWNAVPSPTVRLQIRPLTTSGHLSHRSAVLLDGSKLWLKGLSGMLVSPDTAKR